MLEGIIGKKVGMTQVYDKSGSVVPVTVIEAGPCFVVAKNKDSKKVQLAFGKAKKISKSVSGQLKKSGIEEKLKVLKEFKCEDFDAVQPGQQVKVDIFKEGTKVAVTGTSIGKGFAGTVKRHHFRRSPMSHGSKSHRIPGSIGAGTTPGRVYKGKRLAGRMGGEQVTVKNLSVVRVDAEKNLLLLQGAVPGSNGGYIIIRKGKA
ncbi:MAG: 50S ribosomal protein L3 [Candidatus Margulisiibacteriota bacterium]